MPSILFVCTANRFRSPLAAAIFKKALAEEEDQRTPAWNMGKADNWEVESAGTWAIPDETVLPDVLEAAKQIGIDLSEHRSVHVDGPLLSNYDLIVVMQESHKQTLQQKFPGLRERIYLFSRVVDLGSYDIQDAYGSVQEVLGIVAGMNELIRRNLRYIGVLAIALHNKRNTSA